jgi:maltooligosyltrehalose trehalohydrolase
MASATLNKTWLRRLPIGAEPTSSGGVHFRVWAPRNKQIEVVLEQGDNASPRPAMLSPEGNGYFSGLVEAARTGMRYRLRLDQDLLLADPASRFQSQGPSGPSEIIDPRSYDWNDGAWTGLDPAGQVLYEMHIGTFTAEGTYRAAASHLPKLADLGITVLAVMPVADFRGQYGWGYDGVNLFAPTRLYGRPDDLRFFVDQAHAHGLGVILDVVYNHFGSGGEFLKQFAPNYFTDKYKNEWGEALNFDGPGSEGTREYILANAGYWIDEFHFDGLRLDATQQVFDSSTPHILAEVTRRVREAAGQRGTLIIGENEPQNVAMLEAAGAGGCDIDALWNDDFHHSAMVALTSRNEAYYTDYLGSPQEFVSAAKWGYLYQGQRYQWQQKRRGSPVLGLPPWRFVNYLQNHDQIANSGWGLRIHQLTSPGKVRAMTALWLLMPQTPMFFQGQEFAADSPFFYFADRPADAETIARGRAKFLQQFRSLATPEMQSRLPDPNIRATFQAAKLDHADAERHGQSIALHRDLLTLRRRDPVFSKPQPRGIDGAVLADHALVLRYFHPQGDRLVICNLGPDLHLDPAPEPLLAPPRNSHWEMIWSSEQYEYGGSGTPPVESAENWRVPGETTVVLQGAPGSPLP